VLIAKTSGWGSAESWPVIPTIPDLSGLGLDEFSMNPPAVPLAKQIIRTLSIAHAQENAATALALEVPQDI
jgi:phosphoenolpyruvate-protein kinase (PTS system EI component)